MVYRTHETHAHLNRLPRGLESLFGDVGGDVKSVGGQMADGAEDIASQVAGDRKTSGSPLRSDVEPVKTHATTQTTVAAKPTSGPATTHNGNILGPVTALDGNVVGHIVGGAGQLVGGATKVVGDVTSVANKAAEGLTSEAVHFVDHVTSLAGGAVGGATAVVGGALSAATSIAGEAIDDATPVVGNVASAATSLAGAAVDDVTSLAVGALDAVTSLAGNPVSLVTALVADPVGVVTSLADDVLGDATSIVGGVFGAATSLGADVASVATSVVGVVVGDATSILGDGVSVLTSVGGDVATLISSIAGDVTSEVRIIVSDVTVIGGDATSALSQNVTPLTSVVSSVESQAGGIVSFPAPPGSLPATTFASTAPQSQTIGQPPIPSASPASTLLLPTATPTAPSTQLSPLILTDSVHSATSSLRSVPPTPLPSQSVYLAAAAVVQPVQSSGAPPSGGSAGGGVPPNDGGTHPTPPTHNPHLPVIVGSISAVGFVIFFFIISFILYRRRRLDARRLHRSSGASWQPLMKDRRPSPSPSPQLVTQTDSTDDMRQSWHTAFSRASTDESLTRETVSNGLDHRLSSIHGSSYLTAAENPFWDPTESDPSHSLTSERSTSPSHSVRLQRDDSRSTKRMPSFISEESTSTTASSIAFVGPGANRKESIGPGPRIAALFGIKGASGHYDPRRSSRISQIREIEKPTSQQRDSGGTTNALLNATWKSSFLLSLLNGGNPHNSQMP